MTDARKKISIRPFPSSQKYQKFLKSIGPYSSTKLFFISDSQNSCIGYTLR